MGFCGARGEREGHIVSLNYGQASALALDPIEKKPFACFMPGARILSYGSYGCNMTCGFCQNADISQVRTCGRPPTTYLSPEALVAKAKDLADVDNVGVALTYNEPLIVPGISDDEAAFCEEVAWLAGISPDIPLHLSRFFPQHRMVDAEPTDLSLMRRFQRIAEGSLTHVLLGNV